MVIFAFSFSPIPQQWLGISTSVSLHKNAILDGCSTVVLNRIGWTGWVASLGGVRCRAPHMTDGKISRLFYTYVLVSDQSIILTRKNDIWK